MTNHKSRLNLLVNFPQEWLVNTEGSINSLQVNGSHPEKISSKYLTSVFCGHRMMCASLAMPNTSYSNGINRFRLSPLTCSVTLDKSSELT